MCRGLSTTEAKKKGRKEAKKRMSHGDNRNTSILFLYTYILRMRKVKLID